MVRGVLKKRDAFEMLGTSRSATLCLIPENLVPKVRATLAGHREAPLSSF